MLKRIISMLIVITFVLGSFGAIKPLEAQAGSYSQKVSGWKQKCQQTSIGKKCKKYKDYTVTAKWSKNDVKKVVKKMDKEGSYNSAVVNTLAGYVNFPTGALLTINSFGWQYNEKKFNAAKDKGKGLQLKYTYRLYKSQSRGSVLKPKWSYTK